MHVRGEMAPGIPRPSQDQQSQGEPRCPVCQGTGTVAPIETGKVRTGLFGVCPVCHGSGYMARNMKQG